MKISCPACNANYRLPDDRVQGKNRIFKIACKRCGAEIRVRGVETPEEIGRTTLPFALDLPESAAVAQAPAQIWFAGMQGRQVGPMSEAEMLDHIGAKRLNAEDLVWRKGFSAWTPAREVPPFDEHVLAASDESGNAAAPAARKRSPRRAQTLELSAAMIELLVKLDGQQSAEPDSGAGPAVEPPELPPLDADVPTLQTPAARAPSPAGVAGDPQVLPELDQVATLVSAVPKTDAALPELPTKDSGKGQASVRIGGKPNVKVDAADGDEPPPAPARTSGAQPAAKAAAAAVEARDSSIRIRLPDEPTANKDRTRPTDNKVALPGQTPKTEMRGGTRTSEPKPAAKGDDKALSTGRPSGIGPATSGSGAMRSAAASTTPGVKLPTKSSGGPMISIVIGVVLAVAIVAVVWSMGGKSDAPGTVTDPAPDANVTAAAADIGPPVAAPVPPPPAVVAAVEPIAAPDANAATPAADTQVAQAEDVVVVAAVDRADAAAKASEAKLAAGKAEAEKAAAAKADAERNAKSAQDNAEKTAKDKADKAAAEKAAAEKREEDRKAAKASKEASDASKRDSDKQKKEEAAQKKAEAAQKALADKAERERKQEEDKAKSQNSKQAAEEKRKAAEEQKKAAADKKSEDLAKKKAADQAKKDAEDAAKQAKQTKKPAMSDDDVEELLRKHDKTKGGDEEGMSQAQVAEVGKKATKSVANCYLLHAEDPNEDTIKVQIMVNSSGSVERATVMGKHGANKSMAGCIADAVKKLVFPTSSGSSKKYTLAYRVGG